MAEKLTRADLSAVASAKAEAARRNGALSRGPTSPEGKARSSQNAVKHGLTAKQFMVLPDDQDEFDAHLAAAVSHWNPQTDYELYLVTKLARVEFQHDRAEEMQNNLVDLEIDIIGPEIQKAFQSIAPAGATALGYKSLNDNSTAHANMDRHRTRLARERVQAVKNLHIAMAERRDRQREEAEAERQCQSAPAMPTEAPAPIHGPVAAPQNEPNAPSAPTPASVTAINHRKPSPSMPPVSEQDPRVNPSSTPAQNEPITDAATNSEEETPLAPAA